MIAELYSAHINGLNGQYAEALEQSRVEADGVLLHSGVEHHYFADDRGIAFQAYGHFLHWLDVNRPNQFVLVKPDRKPVYYQVIPADFWYEQEVETDPLWHDTFEVVRLDSLSALQLALPAGEFVYCGESPGIAEQLGIPSRLLNPTTLLHILDFNRAYKSEYELVQLRDANRLALIGHEAARECFLAGGSEYDIHMAYLSACKQLEDEMPYTNIVALDEKAAILHYQNKRRTMINESQVLLIDAGYRVRGYGSDITRTTARDSAHPVFQSLLQGMEKIEQQLVSEVAPEKSYVDIHLSALRQIGELLVELEICNGDAEELLVENVPHLFMPHGVGHLLGINVHDVGGHQKNVDGDTHVPPEHSPMLRNTRTMAENMVFTIEPGCYFIPLLLEPERESERGKNINWSLIDQLYAFGGIRIEDNVRVTTDGVENLTRSPAS